QVASETDGLLDFSPLTHPLKCCQRNDFLVDAHENRVGKNDVKATIITFSSVSPKHCPSQLPAPTIEPAKTGDKFCPGEATRYLVLPVDL
ncbi:hypothetical protein BaRGS_00007750, partial [Batillaria attramentaria]